VTSSTGGAQRAASGAEAGNEGAAKADAQGIAPERQREATQAQRARPLVAVGSRTSGARQSPLGVTRRAETPLAGLGEPGLPGE